MHLFENESGYITGDGRLFQKDNAFFKGRELRRVNPDGIDGTVRYYEEAFSRLSEYTDKMIRAIHSSDDPDRLRKFELLIDEIKSTDALGSFEELLSRVESQIKNTGQPDVNTDHISASENSNGSTVKTSPPTTSDTESAGTSEVKKNEPGKPSEAEPARSAIRGDVENSAASEIPEPLADDPSQGGDTGIEDKLEQFAGLVEKAEELSGDTEWQYTSLEFDNLKHKWHETGFPEEGNKPYSELQKRFQEAEDRFNERKSEFFRLQKEKKKENLGRRQTLLEQLQQIVREKKWQAIDEIRHIQRRWENIKKLPEGDAREQDKEYASLLDVFEKNKVEYLVSTRQKEEDNLTGKLAVLDKLSLLLNETGKDTDNWEATDKKLEELTRQWKKIGRVPREQAAQIRDKFSEVKDQYYAKKFRFNPEYKKQIQGNIEKMRRICEEAEKLNNEEDLANAARQINNLHKKWKTIGHVPGGESDELWDRFKAASDAFNKRKSENIDELREQEQLNFEKKEKLCEQAEALKDSDAWIKGVRKMNDLMEEWKQIGPVPRKKSGKIWRRFKKAMDDYYKKRRDFFREQRKEQKQNLDRKKEIIEEIRRLGESEEISQMVDQIKSLQEKFGSIGFVPIKKKDAVQKEYREACDAAYSKLRSQAGESESRKLKAVVDHQTRKDNRKKENELVKLRKEHDKLTEEVLHYEDYKTFIKPSKKGMQLLDDIQAKIDTAKKKQQEISEKIEALHKHIYEVKE